MVSKKTANKQAKKLGRRAGPTSSRGAIVEAARREFAEHGYDRATMRSIAAAAGVDPSLLYHFFSGKDDLLAAALEPPVEGDVVDALLPEEEEVSGAELLGSILALWEQPAVAQRITALARVATTHPDAGAAVSKLLDTMLLGRLAGAVRADRAELRAALVASQVMGLALLRLVIPVAAIAEADAEELVAAVAPTLERYALGDLGTSS